MPETAFKERVWGSGTLDSLEFGMVLHWFGAVCKCGFRAQRPCASLHGQYFVTSCNRSTSNLRILRASTCISTDTTPYSKTVDIVNLRCSAGAVFLRVFAAAISNNHNAKSDLQECSNVIETRKLVSQVR